MKRRHAIRQIAIITAGVVFIPACKSTDKSPIPLKNFSLTESEQDLLSELTETILPKTNTFPGAKDLKAPEFVLTMVDDCLKPEDQKTFTNGLKAFNETCHGKFN